jgi:hypothetical protein
MQLAEKLYRRPLRVFDLLNKKVAFRQFVDKVFAEAKALPETSDFRSEQNGLYEYLDRELIRGSQIDYLEFGVAGGATIAKWTSLNLNQNSRFYGFDSFEGLPSDWHTLYTKGTFGTHGRTPNIDDRRVEFVKGWFHKSLPAFLADFTSPRRLVVNIDSDLYASALCVLTTLDRWLIPGSLVIFDEFRDVLNEFDAWCDYCTAYWREARGVCFTPRYRKVALLMR